MRRATDSQTKKIGQAALAMGVVMALVFLIPGILIWIVPTATHNQITGEDLYLPFSGVGMIFLGLAGLLIARIGWSIRGGADGSRPRRHAPRNSHGEWSSS